MERLTYTELAPMDVPAFLWQHRKTVLTAFLVGMTITLFYFAVAPRKYRSEAKVLVRIGRESITLDPTATTGQFVAMAETRDSELHEVEELLASRGTAEKVVDQFGPRVIMEKKGTRSVGDMLSWLNVVNLNPLRVYSVRDKAVKALQKNLGISAGKKSNILTVSYKASNPQHAHDVLEALLTTAREDHARVHRTSGSQKFFESQRELLGNDLREQEQGLREYKDNHGLASLTAQRDAQVGIIAALQSDLLRARAEQSAAQAEVDLRHKQLRDQPTMVVTEQTTGQPQTAKQTLREKLYELEVREQELAARLKPEAPQLEQIRTQIGESRRIMGEEQINMETKRGLSQTHQAAELALQERQASLVALSARCEALDSKLATANDELKKLNAAELDLNRIEREIDLTRVSYRKYSENLEQVRIDQELEAAKISSLNLMQPPTLSETPATPEPLVTLTMGGIGSLLAGIGVALLYHQPSRKRRSGSRRAKEPAHENGSAASLPPIHRGRRGQTAVIIHSAFWFSSPAMSLGLVSTDQPRISGHDSGALPRLTVVAPLFNEAESIEQLKGALTRLRAALSDRYEAEFVLVDDGSIDGTSAAVDRLFAGDRRVRCIRHVVNRGLAAALATGIAEARTPIVASIDADCTYEPVQLLSLLERFDDGVDMVVASPYHPDGQVVGVPAWRIAISKLASRLYRCVLRNQLHTYTSCFRVYRRSSVVNLPQTRSGFVGVVEMLWQLDRRGGTIVECPAVLTVRKAGRSKMRILATALGHLRLIATAAWQRLPVAPRGERSEPLVARPIG